MDILRRFSIIEQYYYKFFIIHLQILKIIFVYVINEHIPLFNWIIPKLIILFPIINLY